MDRESLQLEQELIRAQAAERQEHLRTELGNVVEYLWPPLMAQIGFGLLLAIAAVVVLRTRRGYLPNWARSLFGVRRTLRSRSDLRPKPSPLQPEAWRH